MANVLDAQRLPAGRRREDVEVARQLHHHQRAAGDEKFGGQPWHGRVVRFAMLGTHYRQPIDWTVERPRSQARATLVRVRRPAARRRRPAREPDADVIAALTDDLNTPQRIVDHPRLAKSAQRGNAERGSELQGDARSSCGLYGMTRRAGDSPCRAPSCRGDRCRRRHSVKIAGRAARRRAQGEGLQGEPTASATSLPPWASQLKDAKDPTTGEIVTTWEVTR